MRAGTKKTRRYRETKSILYRKSIPFQNPEAESRLVEWEGCDYTKKFSSLDPIHPLCFVTVSNNGCVISKNNVFDSFVQRLAKKVGESGTWWIYLWLVSVSGCDNNSRYTPDTLRDFPVGNATLVLSWGFPDLLFFCSSSLSKSTWPNSLS